MNVLHVTQSTEYGVGAYLGDMVGDQVRRGWDVAVAGDPDSPLRRRAAEARVTWLPWTAAREPGPSVLPERRALAGIVAERSPDVVHLHSSKAGLVGRLALRGRRPTIFQPQGWSFLAGAGPKRTAALWWERLGARWADVVLCCSEAERAHGEAVGIKAAWKVVPNAVDLERFRPGDRAAARGSLGLGLADDGPMVLCVGRLAVAQKGQDVLLEAWPTVTAAFPQARLVLVGEGPDRAALEAAAPDGVTFAGQHPDVRPWYQAADLVVQPSRYEGLSLAVLEALACGRSVVAADAIGMREAVGDAGAIVPVGDARALAAAVVARLRDPALAAAEGERARTRAEALYGSEAWGSAIAAVTLDVASR